MDGVKTAVFKETQVFEFKTKFQISTSKDYEHAEILSNGLDEVILVDLGKLLMSQPFKNI